MVIYLQHTCKVSSFKTEGPAFESNRFYFILAVQVYQSQESRLILASSYFSGLLCAVNFTSQSRQTETCVQKHSSFISVPDLTFIKEIFILKIPFTGEKTNKIILQLFQKIKAVNEDKTIVVSKIFICSHWLKSASKLNSRGKLPKEKDP